MTSEQIKNGQWVKTQYGEEFMYSGEVSGSITRRSIEENECIFVFSVPSELEAKTMKIGHVRIDFGRNGKEFWSTWWGAAYDSQENNAQFKSVINDVINSLRLPGEPLENFTSMEQWIWNNKPFHISDHEDYGIRVDTEEYAFILRLTARKGDYNCYCHCFIKRWLDEYLQRAQRGIPFRDVSQNYKEIFRLKNGGTIAVHMSNGDVKKRTCYYIDECHCFVGNDIYHVDQYAELIDRIGAYVSPE